MDLPYLIGLLAAAIGIMTALYALWAAKAAKHQQIRKLLGEIALDSIELVDMERQLSSNLERIKGTLAAVPQEHRKEFEHEWKKQRDDFTEVINKAKNQGFRLMEILDSFDIELNKGGLRGISPRKLMLERAADDLRQLRSFVSSQEEVALSIEQKLSEIDQMIELPRSPDSSSQGP